MRFVWRGLEIGLLSALLVTMTLARANAAPPQGAPDSYVVQSGDTLFAIALKYHTTVPIIKQLNGIGASDVIQVGQKLLVPSGGNSGANASELTATAAGYTVQAGDTLLGIALRYGTTINALEQLNGIANSNLIAVGQAVAIPSTATATKPGLVIDPPVARQGGTVLIQVARPNLASVTGMFNGQPLVFTRSVGFFYAIVGISRCAKIGSVPISVTTTDSDGQASTETAALNVLATAFVVQSITLPPGKGALLEPTLVNREAAQLATLVNKYTPSRLWNGVFRQPLYGAVISAQFGSRRSYNGGPVGACGHEGTDMAIDSGTPIYAPARGMVVFAGLTQVRGNMTVIDHGVGVYSAYYHQSALMVQAGQMVEQGDLIGKVGTTGLSTGPHLHWSMWAHGEYVDPMEWTRRMIP